MASYFFVRSLCAILLMFALNAGATSPTSVNLDNELGRLVAATYTRVAKAPGTQGLANILPTAEKAYRAQDYAGALHILASNRALDASRLGEADLQPVVRLALELYCHRLVEQLLAEAQQQADRLAEAKLVFELARFYAENQHWPKITALLNDDSLFEQLSKKDAAEAYVLLGTALQKQKKHREAIPIYEKVGSGSGNFRIAQLNLASAFLRQEWWTDAHTAINAALAENNKGKRDALDYRLFTILGYSQIQFGFYRDARESFRNVAISSEYAQRALLGLGIAALHQQDFIGALNAFDKLRVQPQQDISVAEAHLLSAFTLRQLEQFDAATSRYQEAIDYYQTLSSDINGLLSSTKVSVSFLRPENNNHKVIGNNARKLRLIDGLAGTSPGGPDAMALTSLKNKFSDESGQRVRKLLLEEKSAIDSYLSQSRFGLASLYDRK